ncbi:hypothetical protein KNP414_04588 [Paenibacillus mucilaginosus KNP414]|uniref:Uncharacterized protein n=1 Tax=Paenibacillus mucilaginosus (strain KNP414) TaxID=1036673 RepID=F8FBR7_PAEMK|nr:hypothetical protein KNP414_04588 [Paenibacillus mucilaginosus KNP414]
MIFFAEGGHFSYFSTTKKRDALSLDCIPGRKRLSCALHLI